VARVVAIGKQKFAEMREGNFFFVDKTGFIMDWWNAGDDITLICRPRRFGKTLTLSMVECFLSLDYANRGEELFGGLEVWNDSTMRELQGTVPVVALSFAGVKRPALSDTMIDLKRELRKAVDAHSYLAESPAISEGDRAYLARVCDDMDDATATSCLRELCRMLHSHHGCKPVVLLDEYDTPMQEAWLGGYWDGMSSFVRSLFNATFKTNPDLGRGLITGITRVASESIFSDLNNPKVITTTTRKYEASFGFTQDEVDAALVEFGLEDMRCAVEDWYDGFTFGDVGSIYNPWSITSFLDEGKIEPYWVNTSSNSLVSSIVRRSGKAFKSDFEELLRGGSVLKAVDEAVTFKHLYSNESAAWSLLLATGYLKVVGTQGEPGEELLALMLTNREVRVGFDRMVRRWFEDSGDDSYNAFVRALLAGDSVEMGAYLADLAEGVMSSFDSGTKPSRNQPERFWHGLVLGLVVDLRGRYRVMSNPESGYGRCDVMLEPLDASDGVDPAIVLEFKVFDKNRGEKTLEDTLANALDQIRDRRYVADFEVRGIAAERIHCWGIAFCGKEVLVG